MERSALRYLVDVLLFVDLTAIAVTGVVLGYVIPPGGGPGGGRWFLGLHRHDWGAIHLDLALGLVALICLHLVLSWKWIVASSRRVFGDGWRRALLLLSGAWLVLLAFAWLLARCS